MDNKTAVGALAAIAITAAVAGVAAWDPKRPCVTKLDGVVTNYGIRTSSECKEAQEKFGPLLLKIPTSFKHVSEKP